MMFTIFEVYKKLFINFLVHFYKHQTRNNNYFTFRQ